GARGRGAYNPQIAAKEAQVRRLHADMQQRFQSQLARYKANLGTQANRSALANVDRGVNVARSGRSMHSNTAVGRRTGRTLNVANGEQARTLQRFMKRTTILNRWVIGLDLGLRSARVNTAFQSGGRRSGVREGFRQVGGFSLSLGAGYLAVGAAKAIGIALSLTPAGWVVLIGAAVVLAVVAASRADSIGQGVGETMFNQADRIYMHATGS
ncbi:hypothetical protein SAMN04488051_1234, partial [Alkalimonas amylolytica]